MTPLQAAAYGLIQGLTEFLPVSSSAHLILFPWFLGWEDPGLAFDVALHWGTLLGVVVYYRKDLAQLIVNGINAVAGKREDKHLLPWKIVLATIPAALAGLLLEDYAETVFRSPYVIAGMLASVAVLLFYADKKSSSSSPLEAISWKQAILIGCAQALAIVPGTSRSGITITIALLLSLNRSAAVRFSFLLSVPIILGAGILKAGYVMENIANPVFLTGIFSAAISGYIAIFALVHLVKKHTFTPFVIYRLLLAGLIVFWRLF